VCQAQPESLLFAFLRALIVVFRRIIRFFRRVFVDLRRIVFHGLLQ